MYKILRTKKFEKALQQIIRSGKLHRHQIEDTIVLLSRGGVLPVKLHDHALKGEYEGSRECHIHGDWLLVYEKYDDILVLVILDTGTHHQLFGT
jgi:mRNA interferase YafQ